MSSQKPDIKPYQAVLLLSLFAFLFITVFWLKAQQGGYKGARYLHSERGALSILVGNEILRYESTGDYSKISLADFGIDSLVGGFSYFPNGDLLLRRGSEELSFIDKIKVFLRFSGSQTSHDPQAILMRCSPKPTLAECKQFIHKETFERSFRSFVFDSDEVLIADTSHHRVLWFDNKGKLINELSKGFHFPNQIGMHNNDIYVANSNKRRISSLNLDESRKFQDITKWEHISFDSGIPLENHHTNPIEFVSLDNAIAVLSQSPSFKYSGIYRIGPEGVIEDIFEIPSDADIMSIALFNNEVLASDYSNYKIYRFSQAGQHLGEFTSPELKRLLDERLRTYERYEQYLLYLYIFGGTAFMLFLIMGVWLERGRQKENKIENELKNKNVIFPKISKPEFSHSEVKWIASANKWAKTSKFINQIIMLVIVSCIISITFLAIEIESVMLKLVVVGGLVLFFLMSVLILRWLKKKDEPKLGVLGQWVLVRDHSGNEVVVEAQAVLYHKSILIAGDIYIMLLDGHRSLFNIDEYKEHVEPRLNSENTIKQIAVWQYLWKKRDPSFLLILGILMSMAIMAIIRG